MIRCTERERLFRAMEVAMADIIKRAVSELAKPPSERSSPQLDCEDDPEKREQIARDAYIEHVKTHKCLM